MSEKTFVKLDIGLCDILDLGSQRCRLKTEVIHLMGLKLASFIKISLPNVSSICSVWPADEWNDTCLRIDKTVYMCAASNDVPSIQSLTTSDCLSITISVVISDIYHLKRCRELLKTRETDFQRYCRNCLLNMCVSGNTEVNLNHSRVGQFYGFSCFLVKSVSSGPISQYGVVKPNTDIEISEILSQEKFTLHRNKECHKLGGLTQPVKDFIEIIKLRKKCIGNEEVLVELPRGILLRGPPGCGKTSIVKHVAEVCETTMVIINGPEVLASRPGGSEANLRQVFNKAVSLGEEGPCLLFLDEIDSLCPKRGKTMSGSEFRITSQLLTLMDEVKSNSQLLIIGATNRPHSLDPAIRRPGRFDREVMLNIPTSSEREEILKSHCSNLPVSDGVDFNLLADWTKGYVGADLALLTQQSAYLAMMEAKTKTSKLPKLVRQITMDHFRSAYSCIIPSSQKGSDALVDFKPVQWSDIGGLEVVKQQIQQSVEWPMKHPEAFHRMGLPLPRGILLYGPPGCCKTTLVKAAATSCKATFLSVSSAQLLSPFVGDAEKAVSEIFRRARLGAPSILFLDEVEALTVKRCDSGHGRGVQERLLSTLLNEIDGIGIRFDDKMDSTLKCAQEGENTENQDSVNERVANVLVIGATNRPDLVDEALLRPGRFDKLIYVPPPDEKTRRLILDVQIRNLPTSGICTRTLASQTEWFTGADLENLCREAALLSLVQDGLHSTCVNQGHFMETLKTLKPSLDESLLTKYQYL